ncbi:hypothetical protein [Streptomyces peucetius]
MSSKESTESAEPTGKSDETPDTETAEAETTGAATDTATGAEKTDADAKEERTPGTGTVNESPKKGAGGRAGVAIAAVLLLACGGLVGYGVLDTEEKPKPPAVPTAPVTYEVTGEGPVEISYLARSEDGTATVVRDAELPWKKTVQVPLGKPPTIAIVLGEKGGQAACTLAIRGEHVQRATAMGEFGRATCAGELPATDN